MHLLLADDHTLFRDALVHFISRLREDAKVTLAKDYYEATEIMQGDTIFDIVILDLCMPGMDGFEGLKSFVKKWPDTPVAIISGVAEKWEVDESIKQGAKGFLPKTLTGKALIKAIDLIIAGEKFVPFDYTPPPQHGRAAGATEIIDNDGKTIFATDIKLTPREKEVLAYLTKGASNQDIADQLGLQVVTIKLHIRGICRKLSSKNRTQAALRAKELCLV